MISGNVSINSAGYITESDIIIKSEDEGNKDEIRLQITYTNPGEYVYFTTPSITGY